MLSLFLVLFLISLTDAGCYQRRLCCSGKNNTCKDVDDGIGHLPTAAPPTPRRRHRHRDGSGDSPQYFEYHSPYYESSGDGYDLVYPGVYEDDHHARIGKLVLPDVIELEGSGADDIFDKYGPHDENAPAKLVLPATSPARKITHFLFGLPQGPDTPPKEEIRYTDGKPRHLLIRYSVLAEHLPLTISTTPASEEDHGYRLQYLEAAPVDCYCDESCVSLGDCCSDYTFVCPPRDCIVGEWSSWEACIPDAGKCGRGEQQRNRHIRQERERGGAECPPTKEMRTCFKECPKKTLDLTTVALLLDYRYNATRSKTSRDNVYWDLPEVAERVKKSTYYCVKYEIGWVNRNCGRKQITKRLFRGNSICAECQPEAQLHRKNGRCASDLEDGDEGFWKLIGPKSCNGIWRRIERIDDCRCATQLPHMDPFLIV